MEQIDLSKAVEELKALTTDETTTELILNNIRFYNDLVGEYHDGKTKNLYLTYQLNVQIGKQIEALKKINAKNPTDQVDDFGDMMRDIKPKK